MRIIQEPSAQGEEMGRLEALERMVKSIFEKLQTFEERLETLERKPKGANDGSPTKAFGDDDIKRTPVTLNMDAMKKGLLAKMWKHLNDGRPSKAA